MHESIAIRDIFSYFGIMYLRNENQQTIELKWNKSSIDSNRKTFSNWQKI